MIKKDSLYVCECAYEVFSNPPLRINIKGGETKEMLVQMGQIPRKKVLNLEQNKENCTVVSFKYEVKLIVVENSGHPTPIQIPQSFQVP